MTSILAADSNRVERMFSNLKQQRRIATRYDKTALSFESFLNLAAARLWLKSFVNTAQAVRFLPYIRARFMSAPLAGGVAARATADLHVDYHRPATSGPLTAHGQIVKIGRQISVAETRVLEPDGKLVASGRGAYFSSTGSIDQRGGTIDLEQALATQGPATSAAQSTTA